MAPDLARRTSTAFDERLTVSWWAWPLALGVAAFLAAELAMGAVVLRHWATFAVAGALAVAGLWAIGRIRVRVTDGPDGPTLCVDDARLPLDVIAAAHPVDTAGRRELLGPAAEPLAFVIQRPWIATGVRIDLNDPADPTPYWYVSTRHPQRLIQALRADHGARDMISGDS